MALTKQAIGGYAEYEQLSGGVETLFKGSADTVMGYAQNAYQTAGLSANEYMETVTGFSASLLQSLGGDTEAAAKYADQAITDMSDNANKMGTDMSLIQNAYQGFAKQNYTMLDNLKLGYGGTQEEMQRLLTDAQAISGVEYDISSYADVVEAIHVIQEEMGIAGTTALEAGATISGSLNAAKSAWQNLLVGIADENQDFGGLVDNFVESVVTVADNLLPRVEIALSGALDLITALIPEVTTTVLPMVAALILQLIPGVSEALLQMTGAIVSALPSITDAAVQLVTTLTSGIGAALPTLIPAAVQAVTTIVTGLVQEMPQMLSAALQLITGLTQGLLNSLPVIIAALPQIIAGIVDFFVGAVPEIVETGVKLLTALIDALPTIIETIVAAVPEIISSIVSAIIGSIPEIVTAGISLLVALIQALPQIITSIVTAVPQIIDGIVNAFSDNAGLLVSAGVALFVAIIQNLPEIIAGIVAAVPQIVTGIVDAFTSLSGSFIGIGSEIVNGIWSGIQGMWSTFYANVSGFFSNIVDGVKSKLGIASPSKVFAEIGGFMAEGVSVGWQNEFDAVKGKIEGDMEFDTATVGVSVADRQVQALNGLTGAVLSGGMSSGPYQIILRVGETDLAEVLFDPLKGVIAQRGESFA